jgi:hypothetical protein
MFRRLKAFAASLALLALLGVQLHLMVHAFGHDLDGSEAPCQVCLTALNHQVLGSVASVVAPEAPTALAQAPVVLFIAFKKEFVRAFDSRGPPAAQAAA